jgi:hypothetical protein
MMAYNYLLCVTTELNNQIPFAEPPNYNQTETVSLNDLFDRMCTQEQQAYARTGALPGWFKGTAGETGEDSRQRVIVEI